MSLEMAIQLKYMYTTPNEERTKIVNRFFEDILPIKDVRNYLLMHIASCLMGLPNKDQDFFVLTGRKGSNGKSLLASFLGYAFCEYFCHSPVSLMTKSREKANEANEAIMTLVNKRIVTMSEPGKEAIQSENLKLMTGGDGISARGLHEKTQIVNIDLKFFMLCNRIPLLSESGEAEMRRLKVINFPTKFCENPKKIHERKIDTSLSDKLKECLNELMHILIEHLKEYRKQTSGGNKLICPKEVTEQIAIYIKRNKSDIDEFIEEFMEIKKDERISVTDVWTRYKAWCLDEDKKQAVKTIFEQVVEDYFEIDIKKKSYFNNCHIQCWNGIAFKPEPLLN